MEQGNKSKPEEDALDDKSIDLTGTDSTVQAAIHEIRKEASRMDLLMALDQLQTLQIENTFVKEEADGYRNEAVQLRSKLEKMEVKISSLELEKQLLQADAANLQEDLQTCVDKMFEISCVAGASSWSTPSRSSIDSAWKDRHPMNIESMECIEVFKSKQMNAINKKIQPWHNSDRNIIVGLDHDSSETSVNHEDGNIFRPIKPRLLPFSPRRDSSSKRRQVMPHTSEEKVNTVPDLRTKKGKRLRDIFRNSCRKLLCHSRRSYGVASMKHQVDELQSIRNRLIMMDKYYETITSALQRQIDSLMDQQHNERTQY